MNNVKLIPLDRNLMQISLKNELNIAYKANKEFYFEIESNKVVAGQIEAVTSCDAIEVKTGIFNGSLKLNKDALEFVTNNAHYYELELNENNGLLLDGKKVMTKGIMTSSGIALLFDKEVNVDLSNVNLIKIDINGVDNILIMAGRIFEILGIYNKVKNDKKLESVSNYLPFASKESSIPCDKAHKDLSVFKAFRKYSLLEKEDKYSKMRYQLMPYIYSSVIESKFTGMPLIRPLAYRFYDEESLIKDNEYLFGSDLLITSNDNIWLPLGECWIEWETGKCYSGGQYISWPGNDGVVFIKGGSIIPMSKNTDKYELTSNLIMKETPAGCGTLMFYETNGMECNIDDAEISLIKMDYHQDEKGFLVYIGKCEENYSWMPSDRTWTAVMSNSVEVYGSYLDCHDNDFIVDEKGFCITECGAGRLINIRFYKK